MNTTLELQAPADAELVRLCLGRDRNAFAQIVTRYQSLVCTIAYNVCGDVGRSEDLAQETFITAWKSLRDLKEPAKLKAWLCGITRNLSQNAVRRDARTPLALSGSLPEETAGETANPHEQAVSKEEETLVWRALETIPATYREPLILFYREGQSTQAVAEALDLSEDAVAQRLSRGRVMLKESVAQTVESTLRRSAPGSAFGAAVLAALPLSPTPAKAATLGALASKGSAAAKTGLTFGVLGSWLGLFGSAYFNTRASIEDTKSPRERQLMIRFFWLRMALVFVGVSVVFGARMLAGVYWVLTEPWVQNAETAAGMFVIATVTVVLAEIISRRRRQIQKEDGTWEKSDSLPPAGARGEDGGAKAARLRVWSLGIAVLTIMVLSGKRALTGQWVTGLGVVVLFGVLFLLARRGIQRRPRYDARFATQAKSVGSWALLTLIFCNYSIFVGPKAPWTFDSAAIILNLVILAAYTGLFAVVVWMYRREGTSRANEG